MTVLSGTFCNIRQRLLDEFQNAVHELMTLYEQQGNAAAGGDTGFTRFDLLIHDAQERKDEAKYAWMEHIESHHCLGVTDPQP